MIENLKKMCFLHNNDDPKLLSQKMFGVDSFLACMSISIVIYTDG